MPKIYGFEIETLNRYVAKKILMVIRLSCVVFAFSFVTFCICYFLIDMKIIDFEAIHTFFAIIIMVCLISIYYFILFIYKYTRLVSECSDMQIILDKNIVHVIMPNKNCNETINIYQCYYIDDIAFDTKQIRITGKITKNEFEPHNLINKSFDINEIRIPRMFSKETEDMLLSKIAKEGN